MPLATVIVTFWAEDSNDAATKLEGIEWPAGADVRATVPVETSADTPAGMSSVPPTPPVDPANPPSAPELQTPAEIPPETPPDNDATPSTPTESE